MTATTEATTIQYDEFGRRQTSNNPQQYQSSSSNHQDLTVGTITIGEISRIESYGCFFYLPEFRVTGLCHISEIPGYIENLQDKYRVKDEFQVLIIRLDDREDGRRGRKVALSLKGVDERTGQIATDYDLVDRQRQFSTTQRYYQKENRDNYPGGGDYDYRPPGGCSSVSDRPRRGQDRREWLQDRAEHRLKLRERTLKDFYGGDDQETSLSYIRSVWGRSPSPPTTTKKANVKNRQQVIETEVDSSSRSRRRSPSASNSSGSSSSSSSENSSSSESSTSSEDTYERRKRSRRESRRRAEESRRSHRRKRRRSRSYFSKSYLEGDNNRGKRGSKARRSNRSRSPSISVSGGESKSIVVKNDNDNKAKEIVDKSSPSPKPDLSIDEADLREAQEFKQAVQGGSGVDGESSDDEGPAPLPQVDIGGPGGGSNKAYGNALLPGEGEAIAQFVQQNLRIPRRGEIGYSADDIVNYEQSGYVMSGSRHARMNAVRIRKENQIYSAEEQRALALITMEENQQKENALINDFKTMLKERKAMKERPITDGS